MWFRIETGVRQGRAVSSVLFNIFMAGAARVILEGNIGKGVTGKDRREEKVRILYTNDTC